MERIISVSIIFAVEIYIRHVHTNAQRMQSFLNFAGIVCTVQFSQYLCIVQQDISITYLNSRSLTTVCSSVGSCLSLKKADCFLS